ncbi:MAG: 6-hydroxymethylpterin diphosphokinase MptE-like protein [Leptospiraceae bacterium]|nr:6-hydroxymethylpterin diphosphokinase MptE-like protein [Leptospiraceae bacterium]
MEDLLKKNLSSISENESSIIQNVGTLGEILYSKTNRPVLKIGEVLFHSLHDPEKEAERLISSLKKSTSERLYIFFGAGLGYSILKALEDPNIHCIWMEPNLEIINHAFKVLDFSEHLESRRLRLLPKPYTEEILYSTFKGFSATPTSFILHRPSELWKKEDYLECKFICEKFFHKKNANMATLSKFESVWTRNLLINIPEILSMKPVSKLFEIAPNVPIVVSGAGPSLFDDLDLLLKYRKKFLLIAVDTSVHILKAKDIDPDLIYSVDPQQINSIYLEGYKGNAKLIFDPTSTYHTIHSWKNRKIFVTDSPFPLMKLITSSSKSVLGEIPYGGSVSTNATSLASMMNAMNVILIGQDLAFTFGLGHSRGAILEERLNYLESRKFRKEMHNYKQLHALQKIPITAYDGSSLITNEKMQIFRKWFEDNSKDKNWINATSNGGRLEKIPRMNFDSYFKDKNTEKNVEEALLKIERIFEENSSNFEVEKVITTIQKTIIDLTNYIELLKEGRDVSQKIYNHFKLKSKNESSLKSLLSKIDSIDEKVSERKELSEFLSLGLQRVILSITEGYESNLSLEEKKSNELGISKKSLLLYEGLLSSSQLMKHLLEKSLKRILILYK